MLSPHHNQHDVLPDTDLAMPVEDRDLNDVEVLQRPLADFAQLCLGHPFVVLEGHAIDITSLRTIPGNAKKCRNTADALRTSAHSIDLRIDGKIFPLHTNEHRIIYLIRWTASCKRRQQGDFVAISNFRLLVSNLLIHRHQNFLLLDQLPDGGVSSF